MGPFTAPVNPILEDIKANRITPQTQRVAQMVSPPPAPLPNAVPGGPQIPQSPALIGPPSSVVPPAGPPVPPNVAAPPAMTRAVSPQTPPAPPAYPGLQRDQAELQRITDPGIAHGGQSERANTSGISQIHSPAARIPLTVLDTIARMLPIVNRFEKQIPGTAGHHQQVLTDLQNRVGQEEKFAGEEAQQRHLNAQTANEPSLGQEAAARVPLIGAQTREANARAANLETAEEKPTEAAKTITTDKGIMQWNPVTAKYDIPVGAPFVKEREEETGKTITTDQGIMQWNPETKRYDIRAGGSPEKPTNQQGNDFDQFYHEFLKDNGLVDSSKNRLKARQMYTAAGEKQGGEAGTWSLQEDDKGNPIEYNSKTGQTRAAPAGLHKAGTHAKAEAEIEPAKQALSYAEEYERGGKFTGPGDEALMERFFELAKPSKGFRMTAPQMQMLQKARGWIGGLEAHARHALSGSYFSEDQRKEITQTMRDLAQARGVGGGGGRMTGIGDYKPGDTRTINGVTYQRDDKGQWIPQASGATGGVAYKPGDTGTINGVTYQRDDKGQWIPQAH